MKQLILTLACLFFWNSSAQAQIPGYQGKRFFMELNGSFFFNLGSTTAQNKGPNSFPFGAHTGHFTLKDRYGLAVHYITGRKSTIKLAYNYQVAGLYSQAQTPALFGNGFDEHDLFHQLHMHDVNIGANFYGKRNRNLAPLGFYWDLGIRLVFTVGNLRDQRVEYADNRNDNRPDPTQLTALPETPMVFMFGLTGMWGYRTVIADRMILNIGLETTLFPQYPFASGPGGIPLPLPGGNGSDLSAYQKGVIQSVQDRYLFGLHIGVGALIF